MFLKFRMNNNRTQGSDSQKLLLVQDQITLVTEFEVGVGS